MNIYLGADHRGYQLKEELKNYLRSRNYEAVDLGASQYDAEDDYPDFAKLVGEKVSADPNNSRGILICGSGAGVAIAANKLKGVRAALAVNSQQAFMLRNDEDVNVLSLSAQLTDLQTVREIIEVFLKTPFSAEERHRRRVAKVQALDS